MTPTVRRYINAALYTATGVVTTFARLHFLAAHPVAQEIVGWVPVLVALAGIGFHLATGDEATLPQSAVEVAKRVAVIALLVAFPARAQAPVLAGDVEAVADPGVAVVAPHATTPLVAADHVGGVTGMIPLGAANLSTPVCTPQRRRRPAGT